ncbi:multiple resistance and pH regulation protein F [Xylanimonas cellulosilytica DSM 15894]|uniref:Multiple resistance and pH regulation protein F n=1 Tax=Xylanimonas cellulosilytica (strain DSM 15894 / JCM 12276 / CECT 5975 / KCTC 9989 / LMG 20990 / NBRC 107835 / XIL07) TaxID=446471 RepID=D1C0I0_XYLCX|nr:monovalent cation/H+ antiporter complex subunit F [Xylanimonas cellulosilytica]ACZ32183.1 multiple resistance and pH regulation protein F [Xylanimonas cellulosilytica DSM 15894]
MIVVAAIATAMIATAAVLALVRLERGPSMLDRTVAFDVLTSTIVGAVAVEAAWSRRTETIPILVVLSLVGFIGSVTIARYAAVEPESEKRIRTAEEVAAEDAAREAALEAALEAERRARRRGTGPTAPHDDDVNEEEVGR